MRSAFLRRFALAALFLGSGASALTAVALPAQAQTVHYTQVEAKSNQPLRVGYYAAAKKDCTAAPLPSLRVLTPPQFGTLTSRQGEVTTDRIPGCPNLKAPAQVVFYQSRPGFKGQDTIKYEITSANGEVAVYDVRINVVLDADPAQDSKPKARQPI